MSRNQWANGSNEGEDAFATVYVSFCYTGGAKANEKCNVAISDFFALHNKAMDDLAKNDRVGFDIFTGMSTDTKTQFLKYCKPFEKLLGSLVPLHRVLIVVADASTDTMVLGFILDARAKGRPKFGFLKVELKFLDNHKMLCLEPHRDFSENGYSPQSEPALQNFQTLMPLEIGLLMGCDVEWASGQTQADVQGTAAPAVPPAGGADGYGDITSDGDGDAGRGNDRPAGGSTTAAAAAADAAAACGGGNTTA